jgi:hypothetical protein
LPDETLVEVQAGKEGREGRLNRYTEEEATAIERLVMSGDYGALTVKQRVIYVEMLCEKLGVNWHTQPFIWVVLNGKLTLYATRNATDQLRSTRGVSIQIVDRSQIGDVFTVRALATMPDGRTDESLGAIGIGGLGGESLANALMKAETKAKRRVTLSICGLSFLDEMEVASAALAQGQSKAEGVRRIAVQPPPLVGQGQVKLTGEILDKVDAVATVEVDQHAPGSGTGPIGPPAPQAPVKYPPATAPIRAKI